MATAEKKGPNGCRDGFTPVWIWCFKQTTLDKLKEPVKDIKVPEFTDPGCEAAISALKTINKSVEAALEAPRKYMNMMQKLIDYPFDVAQNMVNTALSTVDKVNEAINKILGGAMGPLDELRQAMAPVLDCPCMADTEIGKLAAAIIDAINQDSPIDELLQEFKNECASTAKEALDHARETPTESLNNLRNAYDSALKRSGIDELVSNMKKLEQCVEQLCAAYDHLSRIPQKVEDTLKNAGAMWDTATGTVKQIAVETTTDLQKQAAKVADDMDALGHLRW